MTDSFSNSRLTLEPLAQAEDDPGENDDMNWHSGPQLLLPRLRIDAFVSEDLRMIEQLRADRRTQRAEIELFDGGLNVAINRYAEAPAPDVILVEQQCKAEDVVGLVDQLADLCPPTTRLILLGDCNDVELFRTLVRSGVSDYLVRPVTSVVLLDTLLGVVEEEALGESLGKVIAFLGVRGGTGASTLSHNVADSLHTVFGATTVLVDTDIGFGTAAMQFDIEPPFDLSDSVKEKDSLTPAVLEKHIFWRDTRFGVLAAPVSVEKLSPPGVGGMRHILDQARRLAKFVIVDMPTGISPWSSEVFEIADEVCLVGGNDLPSLRNARTCVQILKKARPNDGPVRFIVNRLPAKGGPVPASEFKRILGVDVEFEISETDIARRAELSGGVFRTEDPKSPAVAQINRLSAALGGFDAPPSAQSRSLLSRFRKKAA